MAKSAKSKARRVLASFTAPVKVEIREPDFEPLTSLAALDLKRLSRGNHKIEIGFLKGGCCPHMVRAIVKNGMVTGCEVEPCDDHKSAKPPPRELMALIETARRKMKADRKWEPIPVAELVSSTARMRDLIIIIGGGCFFFCIFGHCIMCCWYPRPHCFIPDIIVGPL